MASPLQNLNLKDMSVLAITYDGCLVRYSSSSPHSSEGDIIAENAIPVTACSISMVVQNRYVFVVGGVKDNELPSGDVYFHDLHQDVHSKPARGPSLQDPKVHPILIVMNSKLFAINCILGDPSDPNPDCILKSRTVYEVLDTSRESDSWQWHTPQPFPNLPPATYQGDAYIVLAYAADESSNTLYLSLGNSTIPYDEGTLCIIYNARRDEWVPGIHEPLPFYGEVKVFDNLFYGFPCGGDRSYLSVYQLDTHTTNYDSDSDSGSCWFELRRYSLSPLPSISFYGYLKSLHVISKDVVVIIGVTALEGQEDRSLEFSVVGTGQDKDTQVDVQASYKTTVIDHHSYIHHRGFEAIVGVWC